MLLRTSRSRLKLCYSLSMKCQLLQPMARQLCRPVSQFSKHARAIMVMALRTVITRPQQM